MSVLDDYFKKGTGSKIPAKGQQFSGVMSREEQKIANQARTNNNFERGLLSKARNGDMQSVALLGAIQNGRVDVSGPTGVRDANPRQDLNIGQNRVDQKNQGVWADQGAGEMPEPGQTPQAAEPQRQVNPNSKLRAGNGYGGKGQKSNGRSIQNPGDPAARAELANGTLAEQQEAIDNGGMAPSATRPAATSPASRVFAGNGNEVPANQDGSRKPSFQEIEDAARERSTKSGAFGKVDQDGKLIKTDYAKVAQDAFKSDLDKSNLIKTGRDYEVGKAPEEVKAAQQKALERGLSLGGNREQLQAMIGMETDSGAKTRKSEEYQVKFADSDEKYKALLDRSLSAEEKANGGVEKMFKASTPQDRLDSISKLAKGPSEKTKELLLKAKEKAADRTGYTGEVTADTNFGKEALDQITPFADAIGGQSGMNKLQVDMANAEGDPANFDSLMPTNRNLPKVDEKALRESGLPKVDLGIPSLGWNFDEGAKMLEAQQAAMNPAKPVDKPLSQKEVAQEEKSYAADLKKKGVSPAGINQMLEERRTGKKAEPFDPYAGGPLKVLSERQKAHDLKFLETQKESARLAEEQRKSKLPEETSKVVRKLFDTNQKVIADRNFFLGKEEETVPS